MDGKTLILLVFVTSQNLFAQYLDRNSFNYVTKNHEEKIQLKDRRSETHVKLRYEITKDKGRKELSIYPILYNSATSTIKVIKASVSNGNKVLRVPPKGIVDSPIVASAHGFDAKNMLRIALPQLKVGSIIDIEYLKIKTGTYDHFSNFFKFGIASYEEKKSIEIISDREIHHEFNDPWKVLHVTSKKTNDGKFMISAKLKRPFGKMGLAHLLLMNMKKLTFLLISTDRGEKGLARVIQSFYSAYEGVINGPLPPTLAQIAKDTQDKVELEDKVNYAISRIIEEYNYLGDWRTVKGQLTPKSFKQLEETKYGDCKDFSSALTAILRRSGVDAKIAWVQRGNVLLNKNYKSDMIFLGGYNHSIVYIRDKEREYWVDPTNDYANGLGINDDIALSEALLLDLKVKNLKLLPPISAQSHRLSTVQIYEFEDIKKAKVKSRVRLSGRLSAALVGAERKKSKTDIEKDILRHVSVGEHKTLPLFSSFSLKNVVNRELDFSFQYTGNDVTREEKGKNYLFPPDLYGLLSVFNVRTKNRKRGHFLGLPYTSERKIIFQGIQHLSKRNPNCDIETKWLSLKSRMMNKNNVLTYHQKIVLKEFLVPPKELRSTNYRVLVSDLSRCRSSMIVKVALAKGLRSIQDQEQNLSNLFKDLPLQERIEKRYEIAEQVDENYGRVNPKIKYTLRDAHELMRLNLKEYPTHEKSYLIQESFIRRLGYYSGKNYSSSSLGQAEKLIDTGISKIGRTPHLLLKKAYLSYKRRKDMTETLNLTNEAVAKIGSGGDRFFFLLLSANYQVIGKDDKYLEALQNLKDKLGDQKSLNRYEVFLGHFYLSKNNFNKCIEHYENYLKEVTNSRFAYNNVGICYRKNKQFDKSISSYKKALALARFGAAENGLALSYIHKGKSLILKKEFKKARKSIEEGLAVRSHEEAYYNLAVIDFLEENVDRAMINIAKVLERTSRYGLRIHILTKILTQLKQMGNKKISNLSDQLFKALTTVEEKLLIATMVLNNLYDRKIYHKEKMENMLSLIKGLVAENPDLVEHNDYVKLNLASSYFMFAIMKNDIEFFERAISLVDKIKDKKQYGTQINMLRASIRIFDGKTGRKPASFSWKVKKKTHIFLQKNFNYRLIDLGFTRPPK